MNKKTIISILLIVIGLSLLFVPLTYYGFIDYIINNTVINMNIERDSIETEKASIAIYNGATLAFMPQWALILLSVVGILFIYGAIAISFIGKVIITKEYWCHYRKIKL